MGGYRASTTILALALASLVSAQCDPTNATTAPCPPIEGFTESLYVDFTKISSVPSDFAIAAYEDSFLHFGSNGLEFRLEDGYSAPYIWTNKYMHYGTASAIIQTAPGIGVISSAVLLSDDGDEIDYEMSGNDFTYSVPTVQTNYYGKAIDGDWDRGTQPQVSANMTNHSFNFTYVWTPTSIVWMMNGTVIRTQLASDCDDGTHQYPQTPARYHVGVWDAGNPTSPWYTALWAGGYTENSSFPSSMYLKSIQVQPYKSCAYYNYSDTTGSSDSVQCLSSLPASALMASATQTQASNAPKVPTATTNAIATCAAMPTPTQSGTSAGCATYYLVQSGDNCATIAESENVSEDDLKTWNPQVGSDCYDLWANYYICASTPGVCNGTTTSSSSSAVTTTSTLMLSNSTVITGSSSSSSAGASNPLSGTTVLAAPSSLQTVASQASATSASDGAASGASSAVPAATGTLGGNPIYTPGSGAIVPAGKPYNITWTPTTSGSISLLLLKGPSSNMVVDSTIANKIANSGYYIWTPSTSLVPTDDATGYGIELIVYASGDYQYSTQFGISNDQYTPPALLDLPVSTDGTCGSTAQTVCKGSIFGDCCSAYGYCGNTTDFCSVAAGCLWQYGTCDEASSSDASSSSITLAATSPGSTSSGATMPSMSVPSSSSSASSLSTSKASSTASSSSATATVAASAVACPSANGTMFQVDGKSFLIECGIDHSAGDLTSITVSSLAACISACASNDACVDVSLSGVACYMKSSVGKPVYNGVYGARLMNSTATSASSVASSSAAASATSSAVSSTHATTTSSSSVQSSTDIVRVAETSAASSSSESSSSVASSTTTAASSTKVTITSSSSVHTTSAPTSTSSTVASSAKSSSASTATINTSATFTTSTKASLSASSTLSSAVATVSSSSADPSGFSYVGCYSEVSGRALYEKSTAHSGMTNEVCARFCSGYAWFATEYGNECYCGRGLRSSSKTCTDGRCKMTCAGDRSKTCGGSDGLSLYKSCTVKAQGPPTVLNGTNDYASMGCWSDSIWSRTLHTVYVDSKMTIELCAAQAKAGGYKYFGVESGNECWMGSSMLNNPRTLDQGSCGTACPGDDGEYCGAGNALQMYSCPDSMLQATTSSKTTTANKDNKWWWW